MIKATLFGLIVVSVAMMWTNRAYVTDAYETTPNTLQLRLGGIDLAVEQTEIAASPFSIPVAPDTRRHPPPALASTAPDAGVASDSADNAAPLVATGGGTARLAGSVVGPEGPVSDAIVGIERHTSDGTGTLQIVTDAEGNWVAEGLPGGRYRVRAWVPSLMTMGGSEVTFLADGGVAEFSFSLWGVDPSPTMEFIHGGAIYDGFTGVVAVAISSRSVDAEGFVVTSPITGVAVAVQASAQVTLASSPIQYTDDQGAARFVLACIPAPVAPPTSQPPVVSGTTAPLGVGTFSARSGTLDETFPLPGCQPVPVGDPAAGTAPNPGQTEGQSNG